ncbi:MATE family efflux transporter [Pseudomaricurvus hydrocarbonicus]|nr:MATE family efflux transporter [Aestuariicella hydrocarbonica]
MILSNISVPLLGLVDTAILGHLPSPVYLSAVALGASLLSIVFWAMGFLRMGTTSLAARAQGQHRAQKQPDEHAMASLLVRSGVLALALGLLLVMFRTPLINTALTWMEPSASTEALARSYSHIRLLSAPFVLTTMVILGWFIGRQNTRVPLLVMVATNLVNVILDMVFIWGLKLNSDGAALATVCADTLGFVLAAGCALRASPSLIRRFTRYLSCNLDDYRELLSINRHLFIRTLCLLLTFAFFTAQGAQMGDDILAANAIIFQLLMLTSYSLDGIAHASEALAGDAVGAQNPQRLEAIVVTTGFWSVLIAMAMSLSFSLGQTLIIPVFTDIAAVAQILSEFYHWVIVLPLACVWAFWLDGIFIGTGRTKTMQNAMLGCCVLVFFPVWWATQALHNNGLWIAFTLFNVARGVSLGWCTIQFLSHNRNRLSHN